MVSNQEARITLLLQWDHYHISPHFAADGKVHSGNYVHQSKKKFPQQDVHHISNVNMAIDVQKVDGLDHLQKMGFFVDDVGRSKRKYASGFENTPNAGAQVSVDRPAGRQTELVSKAAPHSEFSIIVGDRGQAQRLPTKRHVFDFHNRHHSSMSGDQAQLQEQPAPSHPFQQPLQQDYANDFGVVQQGPLPPAEVNPAQVYLPKQQVNPSNIYSNQGPYFDRGMPGQSSRRLSSNRRGKMSQSMAVPTLNGSQSVGLLQGGHSSSTQNLHGNLPQAGSAGGETERKINPLTAGGSQILNSSPQPNLTNHLPAIQASSRNNGEVQKLSSQRPVRQSLQKQSQLAGIPNKSNTVINERRAFLQTPTGFDRAPQKINPQSQLAELDQLKYAGHRLLGDHQHYSASFMDNEHYRDREQDMYRNPYGNNYTPEMQQPRKSSRASSNSQSFQPPFGVEQKLSTKRKKGSRYEMNHQAIGGVEQLKYFDRLNRAAARQQQIYNVHNHFLHLEQQRKAQMDLKEQEENTRKIAQSDIDFENQVRLQKNAQNLYRSYLDHQVQEKADYEKIWKKKLEQQQLDEMAAAGVRVGSEVGPQRFNLRPLG